MDRDRGALDSKIGTQTNEFGHMHKTIFENRFRDRAFPFGQTEKREELRLHVGRKRWEGRGFDPDWMNGSFSADTQPGAFFIDFDPGFPKLVDHG